MFHASSWAKNTAGGLRVLLVFNIYSGVYIDLFLAQCEQVHLFLALALFLQIRSGI